MKSRRDWRRGLVLVLALAVVVPGSAPGGNARAQTAQQAQGPAGNGWRTLAQFSTGTSASFMTVAGIKQSSGDWAAYATSYYACGHCGFVDTDIHLRHVLDGRQVGIKGSRGTVPTSGDPTSVQEVRFAEPYLLWYQPGPGNALPPEQFTPGRFACTLCYYNVATDKGGPLTALVPSLPVPGDTEGAAMPVALDPTGTGRALIATRPFSQNGMARLYLADLKTGVAKEIAALGPGQDFTYRGATIYGDMVAWIPSTPTGEGASVYIYDPKTGQVSQPQALAGLSAYALRSNGRALFFSVPGPSDLHMYDPATGQVTTVSNTGAFNYDVYGDLLAYTPPEKGRIIIRDLRNNGVVADLTVISPEAAAASPNVPVAISLSGDKLVFSVVGLGGTGTVYAHHLGISWLAAANPPFDQVWARADGPVASHKVSRSWLWGPAASYTGWEPYVGLPDGKRQVRYYDKSRMEVNDPEADPNDPFYVTNGLLAAEMIGGEIRLGESEIRATTAATLTVAGDPRKDNPLTPSYAALRGVASIKGDHTSTNRTGQYVSEAMDVNGTVSQEGPNARAARYAAYVSQTGHNIPDLFWTYLRDMRAQYGFDWTYTMGYPITEAYWTRMRVSGIDYPVLVQAYQRRVMTYAPAFPAEWRVQQGNVGQHYFEWRYVLTNK
ncbi:MAG: hypothetical protein ACJ78Q_07015 [Chloroflexia bacterium]